MPNLNKKQQEVFEACDALLARGEKIIIETVGHELLNFGYKRGSNTVLAQYVREWRATQSTMDNLTAALPQRSDKLISVIDEIRLEARREAQEKLILFQEETENKMKEMLQTLSFSQEEIKQVREQNAILEKNLTEKTHHLTASENRFNHLEKELNNTLTKAAHDREQAQTKLLSIQEEKSTLLRELDDNRHVQENIVKEYRATISDMMEKMESLRHQQMVENDKLKTELHHTEQLLEKSLQTQTQLHEQHDALKKQLLLESQTKGALDLVTRFFNDYKIEQVKKQGFNAQLVDHISQLASTENIEKIFQQFSTNFSSEIHQLTQDIKITQEAIQQVHTVIQTSSDNKHYIKDKA